MHAKKLLDVGSCVTIVALLLAGCAPAAAPPAPPKQAPAQAPTVQSKPAAETPVSKPAAHTPSPKAAPMESGRYGGVLTKSTLADPPMLDFSLNTSLMIFEHVGSVYNGLFQYDPLQPDKIINDLVEKWEASPDGKVYIFHLKTGIKWHDGKPFSAEDAAFTLMRNRFDKRSQLKDYAGFIEKAEASGPNTLKVTLEQPWSAFLANLAIGYSYMVPKHVVEAKGDLRTTAIGTGPFKLKDYSSGVRSEVVKNPDYFIKGRPYLDKISVLIVRDDAVRFAAFRTGQIKLTGISNSALSSSQAKFVKAVMSDKVNVLVGPALAFPAFIMQTRNKPWDDVRVRQAANLAIDRMLAIKVLEEGEADVGGIPGVVPRSEWSIPEDELLKMPGIRPSKEADREQAKKLLAEAGFPGGLKTKTLTRADYSSYIYLAQFVQNQLATVGIDLEIDAQEGAVYMERRGRFAYETMSSRATTVMADPDGASKYFGADNIYGFRDEKSFELFSKQRAAMDVAARKKLVIELQKRGLEVVPYVVLSWAYQRVGIWNEVRNYKAPIGNYNNHKFQDVWMAK
ncbi:MAG: ABC transporter substrate-binding protein [Chloroflexi bacterium]|nr:ABC transporter substrate-binding protein [Chloroflexota bacterium]